MLIYPECFFWLETGAVELQCHMAILVCMFQSHSVPQIWKFVKVANLCTSQHYISLKYACFVFIFNVLLYLAQSLTPIQGSIITIKSPYVITYVCQNFGVRDVFGQIPKSIYQASCLLPGDFPDNFS